MNQIASSQQRIQKPSDTPTRYDGETIILRVPATLYTTADTTADTNIDTSYATETRRVIELNDTSFSVEILADLRPVMVCFYSAACAPSQKLTELLEHFAEMYSNEMKFTKLAIPENPLTVSSLRITSIPTIRILKSGTTHWHYPGIPNSNDIKDVIESFIPKRAPLPRLHEDGR